jgi:hypothetical protein
LILYKIGKKIAKLKRIVRFLQGQGRTNCGLRIEKRQGSKSKMRNSECGMKRKKGAGCGVQGAKCRV